MSKWIFLLKKFMKKLNVLMAFKKLKLIKKLPDVTLNNPIQNYINKIVLYCILFAKYFNVQALYCHFKTIVTLKGKQKLATSYQ